MSVKFDVNIDDKHFENRLRVLFGVGTLFKEAMMEVGNDMAAESRSRAGGAFKSRSGKLLRAIKFIPTEGGGVLTTKTSLTNNKAKTFYASFIEHGTIIRERGNKVFRFKINGQWRKITPNAGRITPRPFMGPVYDEYFGGENAKGYQLLAMALKKRMEQEAGS
jgi:hypothetical protein